MHIGAELQTCSWTEIIVGVVVGLAPQPAKANRTGQFI
jgi:hypothetical protein